MLPFIKEAITQLFSKPSTEGYPFVPKEAPDGYRGRIAFHPEKCINCGMCERVCAGGAISTTSVDAEGGFDITRSFNLGSCTFCACCADFCSTKAIEMTKDYHMVARCEDDLIVKGTYFKKKPAPRVAPAPKPVVEAAPATDAAPATPTVAAAPAPEAPAAPEPRDDGKPVNDTSKCIFCGICAKKCPVEALSVDRATKSWVLDDDKCIACGTCADVCPKKSIII